MDNVIVTPHALCWTDELFHDIAAHGLRACVDLSLVHAPARMLNPQARINA